MLAGEGRLLGRRPALLGLTRPRGQLRQRLVQRLDQQGGGDIVSGKLVNVFMAHAMVNCRWDVRQ